MEIKSEYTVKGTRILAKDSANFKRDITNKSISLLRKEEFDEIIVPILQFQKTFSGKVGNENQKMMYAFKDAGDRDLCLAPEYTANIMKLSDTTFKFKKDVKLFYVSECFRAEKPSFGRFRQFTQLGVEILNPTKDYYDSIIKIAENIIKISIDSEDVKLEIDKDAKRGLDYYKGGRGFEIRLNELGSQKQICGGGEYEGGIGFAIGIDRLLSFKNRNDETGN